MPDGLFWHRSPFQAPEPESLEEPLPVTLKRLADLHPDRPAVITGTTTTTFGALMHRAIGLGEHLRHCADHGPVALLLSCGPDAIAAWFACAIAGRPFLLLDAGNPPNRLLQLIGDAGAGVVLCDDGTIRCLGAAPHLRKIRSDEVVGSPMAAAFPLDAHAPLAIFPTSGSTGPPKLVVYSTVTLLAKVRASMVAFRISSDDRVVIAGSHGTFGFVHHALSFLLGGSAICLVDLARDGVPGLVRAIDIQNAGNARFVPSVFRSVARLPEARHALRSLRAVRFSGEPLLAADLALAEEVLSPACFIQNVYGSTESGLFVWSRGERREGHAVSAPIGRIYPLWEYAILPLEDADGPGEQDGEETGELLIRSPFHPPGDLCQGRLDASRFPASSDDGAKRLFRTRDIVRRSDDGQLQLLGRSDRMVKVNGNRVFLTEIEETLRAMPGVEDAAVVSGQEEGRVALYGFILVPGQLTTPAAPRVWLAERLPRYMIPGTVEQMKTFPRLPGGKVDYAALTARAMAVPASKGPGAPIGEEPVAVRLRCCWNNVLGGNASDAKADFFERGGDSLSLVELAAAFTREFQREFPLDHFLADPTLRGLQRALDSDHEAASQRVCLAPQGEEVRDGLVVGAPARPTIFSANRDVRLRHVRGASSPSRGIALAMPGWGGTAQVLPFLSAGLFNDHEVWAADFLLSRKTILHDHAWIRCAVNIADFIRSGAFGAPRILFGFSAAGSIAWLVGRLLAGTPWCPELVLMVDAAPLHRMKAYRSGQLDKALAAADPGAIPDAILLCRSQIPGLAFPIGHRFLWHEQDNVRMVISVPTVSHADMCHPRILARAVSCLQGKLPEGPREWHVAGPEVAGLAGGRKHAFLGALMATKPLDPCQLSEGLVKEFSHGELEMLVATVLWLADRSLAESFLRAAVAGNPGTALLRYAWARIRRSGPMLCHEPGRQPSGGRWDRITNIENIIFSKRHENERSAPRSIRRTVQLLDLVSACLGAVPSRVAGLVGRALRWSVGISSG